MSVVARFLVVACIVAFCTSRVRGASNDWIQVPDPAPDFMHSAVRFSSPDSGFISSFIGQLYSTTDGGLSWQVVDEPPIFPSGIRTILFTNDSTWVFSGLFGLAMSKDFGQTWTTASPTARGLAVTNCSFVDERHGAIILMGGYVFYTLDGGSSWIDLDIFDFDAYWKSCAYSVNHAIGVCGGPELRVTLDFGQSWREYVDTNISWNEIRFRDAGKIAAFGYHHTKGIGVYASSIDTGLTWVQTEIAGSRELVAADFCSPDAGVVADQYTIYETTDGGQTWTEIYNHQHDSVLRFRTVSMVNDSVVYVQGNHGLIKSVNLSTTHLGSSAHESQRTSGVHCWPNPASSVLNVAGFDPECNNAMQAQLSSTSGAIVERWEVFSSTGEFTLPLEAVPNGIYTLHAQHGRYSRTGKVVVIR
ncbi:MAG: hypothetical protein J5I53_02560 [Bradyrhizobiaceae bacterium]|nr:hypothetical protein [Bradyrhizobiaceae bacterium]